MILQLLWISLIWVLVLDLCGFSLTIDKLLYKLIYRGRAFRDDAHFPPFDCSLCMTFWTGLFYLLLSQAFTLFNLVILLCFAWGTMIEKDIFTLIKDLTTKLIDKIYDTFKL